MLRAFAIRVVAAALMMTGCGGSAGSTPATAAGASASVNPSAAERLVTHFESLAADLQAVGSDCERMAAALSGWVEKNRGEYAQLSSQARDSAMAPGERQDYEERLRNALSRAMGAMTGCSEHAGAQTAFSRFDELVDSSPESIAPRSQSRESN